MLDLISVLSEYQWLVYLMFFRLASQELRQSHGSPSAGEVALKYASKFDQCQTSKKDNEMESMCVMSGKQCNEISCFILVK